MGFGVAFFPRTFCFQSFLLHISRPCSSNTKKRETNTV